MSEATQVAAPPMSRVTLIVPTTGDAGRVARFIRKAGQTLESRVLRTIGSWEETLVTLECTSLSPAEVLGRLTNFPEVERVQEKQLREVKGTTYQEVMVCLSAAPTGEVAPMPVATPKADGAPDERD